MVINRSPAPTIASVGMRVGLKDEVAAAGDENNVHANESFSNLKDSIIWAMMNNRENRHANAMTLVRGVIIIVACVSRF